MDLDTDQGFLELKHTADWAVQIWAPNFPALLVQSAMAMFEMTGISLEKKPRVERVVELAASDEESLLVAFLSELLYLQDVENLGFDSIQLSTFGYELQGCLSGAKIACRTKEIKAVTYHNMQIIRSPKRLEVTIVFDV